MHSCYIALGSNLENPLAQIKSAFNALQSLPNCRVTQQSSLYRSAPMGPQEQPDYINAVIQLDTSLSPDALLQALQALEQAQGRQRNLHWGPRTLDLDILLYGQLQLQSESLTIPHPGLYLRNFVLYPLAEIAPKLIFPDGSRLADRLSQCDRSGLEKLD
jgi:2-amino-4-hydroxy-6-hydroxymethyldihydropteridine diphosphokinase